MWNKILSCFLVLLYIASFICLALLAVNLVRLQEWQEQALSTIAELDQQVEKRQAYEEQLFEYAVTAQKELNASTKIVSDLYLLCRKETQLRREYPELDKLCQTQLLVQTSEAPEHRSFTFIDPILDEVKPDYLLMAFLAVIIFALIPLLTAMKLHVSQGTAGESFDGRMPYQRGYRDGKQSMVMQLIEGINILSEIQSWLHAYQHGQTDAKNARAIFTQLLSRMKDGWHLEPIGYIGQEDTLRLSEHTLGDKTLKIGEKVYIAEPGWRLEGETLVQPVVKRGR